MDREQELIRQIGTLDDDSLRAGLGKVAQSMGIAPNLAAMYLSDMKRIRETLSSLTPEDLQKITANLGEENMNQILGSLKGED
jgi:hypothetical protein